MLLPFNNRRQGEDITLSPAFAKVRGGRRRGINKVPKNRKAAFPIFNAYIIILQGASGRLQAFSQESLQVCIVHYIVLHPETVQAHHFLFSAFEPRKGPPSASSPLRSCGWAACGTSTTARLPRAGGPPRSYSLSSPCSPAAGSQDLLLPPRVPPTRTWGTWTGSSMSFWQASRGRTSGTCKNCVMNYLFLLLLLVGFVSLQ